VKDMGMHEATTESDLFEYNTIPSKLDEELKKIAEIKNGKGVIEDRISMYGARVYITNIKTEDESTLVETETFYINITDMHKIVIARKGTFTEDELDRIKELGYMTDIV